MIRHPASRLFLLLPLLLPAPASAQLSGGDDVFIEEDYGTTTARDNLTMTSDGRLFHAIAAYPEVRINRSLDGGTTWHEWGTIPHAPTELIVPRGMHLAEGTQSRLHVLYEINPAAGDRVIRHAWANPLASSPTWTVTTAFAEAGVDFSTADFTSDVFQFDDYYLYAVAQSTDASGDGDIWFVRSTTQGDSWQAEYKIGDTSGVPFYIEPKIAYGGGRVHVAWSYGDYCSSPECWDNALRYRYANSFAAVIGNWQPIQPLTALGSGVDHYAKDIVASVTSDEVHILYSTRDYEHDPLLWRSDDGGSTWSAANRSGFASDMKAGRLIRNAAGTRLWITGLKTSEAGCVDQPFVIQGNGSPPSFQPAKLFSPPRSDRRLHNPAMAPHPTAPDDYGIAWSLANVFCGEFGTPSPAFFDATWFDDPGYPNLEPGFPAALTAAPASPPALAELDGDPFDEIVWSDVVARVHVTNHTGVEVAGWPFDTFYPVVGGAVAVGDLHNDGRNEVVAGNAKGRVWALDRSGAVLSGFPVDLGTDAPTRVTVAPVRAPYPRSIVATSANRVFVINHAGGVVGSWTLPASIDYAAAVGDVDGDDLPDIFVAAQDLLVRLQPGNPIPVWTRDVTLFAISAPPTLADLDLNGVREILVPTVTGMVTAYSAAGSFMWGYDTGTSSAVSAVAAAHILGPSPLEMAVTSLNGIHLILPTGASHGAYPQSTAAGGGGNLTAPIMNGIHWPSSDIVAASSAGEGWAWVNIGGITPGWPKDLGAGAAFSPATGDIDDDGDTEVVVLTNTHLLVMDVNSPPHPVATSRWPMWGNDPGRSFCQGCQAEPLRVDAGDPAEVATPLSFAPPRPNPSTGPTVFSFALPKRAGVDLSLFDLGGRRVRDVLRREFEAGTHSVTFDGRDEHGTMLASGVYVARLSVRSGGSGWEQSRRLTLIR